MLGGQEADVQVEPSTVYQRQTREDEVVPQPHYGEVLSRQKKEDELLCMNVNINGLPRQPNKPKERMLQKLVTDYGVDVLGCSEINLNWYKLKQSEQ